MAAMSLNDDADASWRSPAETTSHSKIAAIYLGSLNARLKDLLRLVMTSRARIHHAFNIVVTKTGFTDLTPTQKAKLQTFAQMRLDAGIMPR
jgi:hypothetical protein